MESLPSLTEVLIDYNGIESISNLQMLLPNTIPVIITTTFRGMVTVNSLPVTFHISLHTSSDVYAAKEFYERFPEKIKSFSVMADDIEKLPLHHLGDVPFYFIFNKFGFPWKTRNYPALYLTTETNAAEFKNHTIDHCMLTRINGQECPASTQLNLYRDGSTRRCPYQPAEPFEVDYSKGCALIGAK